MLSSGLKAQTTTMVGDKVVVTYSGTNSSNFVVPEGVTQITIEAWGPGGKGATRTTNGAGGGGGGGAYVRTDTTVTPGTTFVVSAPNGGTGNDSYFGTSSANHWVRAKAGANVSNNTATGGAGGSATTSIGQIKRSGGNGGNGSGSNGGGGGSSAGTAANGNNGGAPAGGAAPAGGGAGGAGRSGSQGAGNNGSAPGGGGGGAYRSSSSTRNGGTGGTGRVVISYVPAYRATFESMNYGSNIWCAGETRTISVTVKNSGQAAWTNANPQIRVGVKWTEETDYHVRADGDNLLPGQSKTYYFSITAPTTTGTTKLHFDVVNELKCWFGNNNNVCGPGNTVYASPNITIQGPTANPITGEQMVCTQNTISLTPHPTGTGPFTYTWNSSNTAVATVNNSGVVTGVANGTANITYTVSDGNGCSITSDPFPVDVVQAPSGTLTITENSGIAPNDGIICAGDNVMFSATAGFDFYVFKVNGVARQSSTSRNYSTNTLQNGDVVTVDMIQNSCAAIANAITVQVNPLPSVSLDVSENGGVAPNDGVICVGDEVTFTATAGYASYAFRVNGVVLQNSSSNVFTTSSLQVGDVVTVSVPNANGCTGTSEPANITIQGLPSGSLTVTENSGQTPNDNTICVGDEITFTAPSGFVNYNFHVNGISVQNGASNTFTTDQLIANPSIIEVYVTNAASCVATTAPQVITVSTIPSGTLSISEQSGTPDDGVICAGDEVIFTATPGFASYTFKVNGSSVQTGTNASYVTSALQNGDVVSVEVTNYSGCSNAFAPITMTVNANPVVTLAATENSGNTANDLVICSGGEVSFTATAGFANYAFQINETTMQSGASSTYTYDGFADGDRVRVEVTNAAGCTNFSNEVEITLAPTPDATLTLSENSGIAANDDEICTGASVTLNMAVGGTNYTFYVNGIAVQNGASNSYVTTALQDGEILTGAVTNVAGCTATSAPVTISVTPLPTVSLSFVENSGTANDGLVCPGETASVVASSGFDNYAFYVNGIIVQNSASNTYTTTWNTTSDVTVVVSNDNLCSNTSAVATVQVQALPSGTLTAVETSGTTPNDGKICSGATVTFTATPGYQQYIFRLNGNVVQNSTSHQYTTSALSHGDDVTVEVMGDNGCTVNFNAIIVQVFEPTPLAPIAGNFSTCLYGSTYVTHPTAGGTWTSADNAIAYVEPTTGEVMGISPGTTTIYYRYTNANGCMSEVSASFTVHDLPSPTVDGPNPFCTGTISVYTTEAGQSNYVWTVTGGSIISGGTNADNTITIDWNLPGSKSIFVNYTDMNGCTGATSATVVGTTTTTPIITGNTQVCVGTTNVVYSTQNGMGNYEWVIDGGTIVSGGGVNDNTVTINWDMTGLYDIQVNFTDDNGCASPTPTVMSVNVNPLPNASISGTTQTCVGSASPYITFTGWSGVAPYTFTYKVNGGLNQTITTTSGSTVTLPVSTATPGSFVYTLVSVTDSKGCMAIVSGTATVTVNTLPTASLMGNTNVCQNAAMPTVTFIGNNGTAPYTFTYKINSGANQTVTSVGNTATILMPTDVSGSFIVTLVSVSDANGCGQTQSGNVAVNVSPAPSATISGTTEVCLGSAAPQVIMTGSGGSAPYTFHYTLNGTPQSIVSVGNTAVINVPTATAGSFEYVLTQVVSGDALSCAAAATGSATVTVTATTNGGTLTGGGSVCISGNSGSLTLSGYTGTILHWEQSTNGGVTWTTINNTTNTYAYTNLTQTTTYRVWVKNGTCVGAYSTSQSVNLLAIPIGGTVNGATTVCAGTNSGNLTLTGYTGSIVRWESSTNNGGSWTNIAHTNATYTFNNLNTTTWFRAIVSNGVCAEVASAHAVVNVNARPTANLSGTYSVCSGSSVQIPITVTGSGTISGMLNGSISFSGTAPTIMVEVSPGSNTTYTITSLNDANCSALPAQMTGSASVTVNALPGAISITPSSATICQGAISTFSSSPTSVDYDKTTSSGSINVNMPDQTVIWGIITIPGDGSNTIAVSGIPAGAVIYRVDIGLNVTHSNIGDMIFNIQAPNGNRLNLINRRGGTGDHLVNTVISSDGVTSLSSASAPFTGTFKADAGNNITAGGNASNVTSFTNLYGTPNGNWILRYRDAGTGNQGVLNNWYVKIYYRINSPNPVVWSPATGLYTDAGATIPYDGVTALSTIYSKGETPGAHVYTATSTNANGCASTATATLNVEAQPVVNIIADYCSDPGKVRLTANSTPAATSYNWNTGETTPFILVDIANTYNVTVTTATGCVNSAQISIAEELIVNGDFEMGNVGFTSTYGYVDPSIQNGMYPEGIYTVSNNPNHTHNNFWGRDHTTGTGNFMIVNGAGSPVTIWQQTVTVQPNTTYYFSAWAISLNSAPPYAQLQFNVNGVNVGTTAVLDPRPQNNNPPFNWKRFYGSWTSGPTTTTAIVSIVDLQTALGGNDFGLDDISFGTLSTFIRLESPTGTDEQTVCKGEPIEPIIYSVGSSATGPTVTGLPAGVTHTFNGERVTISGTPTTAGIYSYTLETTGCNPTTLTGTIIVEEQSIQLTSGNSTTSVCQNAAMAPIVYTIGGTATDATVTGLPNGVTGVLVGNTFEISGTPTDPAGNYTFTITTVGDCSPATATGTIQVMGQQLSLISGTADQTKCINTAITNVVLTMGGTTTGATVTGLPTGVNMNISGSMIIISGVPTVEGVYPYTVTTTGTCTQTTFSGTITVQPAASIQLASTSADLIQNVCRNEPIANIILELGGGATGAYATGLPTGVSGTYADGEFIIAGTPTSNGTYNFTVHTTGTCAQTSITGKLVVQSANLSLASGATNQTRCFATAIANVTYNFGGAATGVQVIGLPNGVTYNIVGSQVIISGTPIEAGTFVYTVSTTGACTPTTLNGTIIVNPETIGGTLTNVVTCSGETVVLELTGYQGTILNWERSTNQGASWTNIANTSPTLTISNILTETWYRVRVRYANCNIEYSTIGMAMISNIWEGTISSEWSDPQNWKGGVLPSSSCMNITIPEVAAGAFYPIITSDVELNNLNIHAGASLTVDNSMLSITGTINNNGSFDITEGTLQLSGNVAQTLNANNFVNNTVKQLLINNSSAAGVTLSGPLNVTGSVDFTSQGLVLNTNGHLTLKSTEENTAWVGNLTGKTINGEVTVERYINTGTGAGMHGKGWQLLAVPTKGGQTIKQSWQENGSGMGHNPVPGYGTTITGHLPDAVAQGFDLRTASGATIKTYNATTGVWDMVTSTNQPIENPLGYMILVRGDRSVITSTAAAVPTVLRTKGKLYTPGVDAPPAVVVPAGKFQTVGNPYASAIDLTSNAIQFNKLADVFYVWDPQLTSSNSAYGLGGYQTFTRDVDGNYRVTPGGGSYGAPGSVKNTIESGQAFIVMSSEPEGGANGSVSFGEDAKIPGSNLVSRNTQDVTKTLRSQLHVVINGEPMLLDGNAVQFSTHWSNDLDIHDAVKLNNTGENFGINRNGKLLSVERRNEIRFTDTIQFHMNQLNVNRYRIEFLPNHLNEEGLEAYLIDRHLNTETQLNLEEDSYYEFNAVATEPGSYQPNRFYVVFRKAETIVAAPEIRANGSRNEDYSVNIRFEVNNENEVEHYEVERSKDGVRFTGVLTTTPAANNFNNTYALLDLGADKSALQYRVKLTTTNGRIFYSNVVHIDAVPNQPSQIRIYPNPITGRNIQVHAEEMEFGTYQAQLVSMDGKVIWTQPVRIQQAKQTITIPVGGNVPSGKYMLVLTGRQYKKALSLIIP